MGRGLTRLEARSLPEPVQNYPSDAVLPVVVEVTPVVHAADNEVTPIFRTVAKSRFADSSRRIAKPVNVWKGVHEMVRTRKKPSHEFKAKVALEAVKGVQSLTGLAARFKVHPTQIAQRNKHLVKRAPQASEPRQSEASVDAEELTAPLYSG